MRKLSANGRVLAAIGSWGAMASEAMTADPTGPMVPLFRDDRCA